MNFKASLMLRLLKKKPIKPKNSERKEMQERGIKG